LRNALILVLMGLVIILSLMLIDLSSTVESLAKSLINRTTSRTTVELNNFFGTVGEDLRTLREWDQNGLLEAADAQTRNKLVVPLLHNTTQISNVIVARTDNSEFMIHREPGSWRVRTIAFPAGQKQVSYQRWHEEAAGQFALTEEWQETIEYLPTGRPWFVGARQKPQGELFWTDPYIFFTGKQPGITVSSASDRGDSSQKVIALDVLLTDISRFTTQMQVSENGLAFVLTDSLLVVGLPKDSRFLEQPDSMKNFILKPHDAIGMETLVAAVGAWRAVGGEMGKAFKFDSQGDNWWGQMQTYALSQNQHLLIGVAVPESDFLVEIKRTRNTLMGGFVLVIIVIVAVVRGYYQKQKANVLLAQKNEQIIKQNKAIQAQRDEIREKNKEIIDSINYARYIQHAILPPPLSLEADLPESFILWMPRDIVSGDFYWFAHNSDDSLILVAADCTGHGVPGAFMSMLGVSFLNELNRTEPGKQALTASQILDQLREKVITSLHQTGEEGSSKDGMDMSLCLIDLKARKLQFAGANNPLVFVRDGKAIESKADRMPIGIYSEAKGAFTNQEFDLLMGDAFYIFSDGFQDQFGGPKGKKFMRKQMKEIFVRLQDQPFKEQKEKLREAFEAWRGEEHQVDDVIVIGFKI